MTRIFYPLIVANITPEIGGAATSVTFDVPPELKQVFRWTAGQHLTLRVTIDGAEHRRCYTISNPPVAGLRITVKRVAKGVVSNHMAEGLRVGDTLDVMAPFGGFCLSPDARLRRTHMFFGAGSGITPLFAMINAVLADEPHSVAHLIYGNMDADSILFKDELETLAKAHPDRFTLRHVLSAPSIWSWFKPWHKGRVDAGVVKAALSETPPVAQDVQYWICGPGTMNQDVKAALMGVDVPEARIHMESFGGADTQDTSIEGTAATAQVILNGTTHDVPVAKGQTILEAIRAAGLAPPFSCQSGVCGACKARLTEGKVHMRARMALEDSDIDQGDILTCQSVAVADRLVVQFKA
ncbi:2Fe-2S iron-sulfur cluster-binding protein [Aliiroseovarius lamellibrachiae]|uniref:2Fe-2S iron-sulfur cluster-binding protein n=1 Tax=Aliiroseovarius lamellibrachiae TaxID=1924933 RepID=UPI001BE0DC48|nr:2Fe-2S iron-sulfur cluster-binding protein [Aliiroseovarius lamellibrachiae]MBT2132293.1 2Fe-2S iron-sulfur cluster binding domain-containing protein [Aliiroseovarius lamellibrachiae]